MIDPEQLPSVSLEVMNTVHTEEVELINGLLKLLEEEAGFSELCDAFDAVLLHMQRHFADEEKMMQEARYPSFRMHKNEHDKILNQTRNLYMDWRTRKDDGMLHAYFGDEISTWLDQHIKAMDTPAADFIAECETSGS